MTFSQKFDYLKSNYYPDRHFSESSKDFAAQITLTDEDCGGTFYVKRSRGKLSVEPYDYRDNTVDILIDSVTLEKILRDREDAVKLYLKGEYSLKGSTKDALEMLSCLNKTHH